MPALRKFSESMTEDLFHFNLLVIPFSFLLGAMTGGLSLPLSLLMFIPLLPYYYFLRQSVEKLSLFLFLTWITCGIGLLTSHKVIYTAFIALLCSHSVKCRTKDSAKLAISFELLCFPLVFLAVLYIGADYLHIPQMKGFIYAQALAVFVLAILYSHLKGINSELELASASSLQATKFITGFANKFLFAYIAGFLTVLALFRFVPFGRLAVIIGQAVVAMLRFMFSLIGTVKDGAVGTPLLAPEQDSVDMTIDELPKWLQILEQIFIYTINILVLLIILAFIAWFFLCLYRGFYAHRGSRLAYSDNSSKVTALKRTPKKGFFGTKPENPIRRKYYKRVNKYFKRRKLTKALTPTEIKTILSESCKEDITQLTEQYIEVRYSQE